VKLLNLYPEQTCGPVALLLNKHSASSDLELQQRACEYLQLDVMEVCVAILGGGLNCYN